MNKKEQREVELARRLFTAFGLPEVQIKSQLPPRPDVLVEIIDAAKRIAIEATEYHGDEANHGGSPLRKQEEQDAAAGQIKGGYGIVDSTPGLGMRICTKVSKRYDLSNVDEFWLVIFAGIPQIGAIKSTFLPEVNCKRLSERTVPSLEKSRFDCCHIFCVSHIGPRLYSWKKGRNAWRAIPLIGGRKDSESLIS